MLKALVFFSLVVLAVAKENSQCETKHNIVPDDWKTLNADPTKVSDKMLCLFKCIYEENGSVNSDGTINVEKMVENVHKWKPLTDKSKTSIKECVKDLGPVKTCADVKASFLCAQTALAEQAREVSQCTSKFQYTAEDMKTLNAEATQLSDTMACMLKCVYEEQGSVNSDGVLNIDKILEQAHKKTPLTDKTRTAIRECLKDLGPIKTCADVNPTYQCVKNAIVAQKKETS